MTLPSFPISICSLLELMRLNGVLIARNPSHDRGYTMAGLLIMAFFGGIGGGVSRDVLLNDVPSPLKDWNYLFVCVLMGLLGISDLQVSGVDRKSASARERLAFFKSFTLAVVRDPWARTRRSITGLASLPRSSLV